jgi:hypothetical protein
MMSLETLVHCQLNEGLTEQELVGDFAVGDGSPSLQKVKL